MNRAILLVDHGSRREQANAQLEALAEKIRERVNDRSVFVAHMELAPPNIGAGIDACVADGAEQIVVHPYFLGPGRHTTHDIPEQVERAAARHPGVRITISQPLGLHPALLDAVIDRIDEAK